MEHRKENLGVIAALKMLDASDRALDKEVAKIIRDLLKEAGALTNKLGDEQWDATIYAGRLASLQVEHRGALMELHEIYCKLGRALREHEGDFEDTDTALLLADEAARMIGDLRKQNGDLRGQIMQRGIESSPLVRDLKAQLEKHGHKIQHLRMIKEDYERLMAEQRERIAKLMDRQQELMLALADAQEQRGAFAPERQDERLNAGAQPVRYDQPTWTSAGTGLTYATPGQPSAIRAVSLPTHGHPMMMAPTIQVDGYAPVPVDLPAPGEVATVVLRRDDLTYDAPNVSRETVTEEQAWRERVAAENEVLRGQKWSKADIERMEKIKVDSFYRALVDSGMFAGKK